MFWSCVKIGFGLGLGVQLSVVVVGTFASLVKKLDTTSTTNES